MRRWLVLAALALGCRARSEPPAAQPEPAVTPREANTAPSLYELPVQLRGADGSSFGVDAQRGHRVLISMFYASCATVCPVLIEELHHVVDAAGDPDLRVLLVSFDPARDTPEQLAALARTHHLDARFKLAAAASDDDARILANAIGFKYRKLADGTYTHTTAVVALDGDGRPFARMDRLGDHDALVLALNVARR